MPSTHRQAAIRLQVLAAMGIIEVYALADGSLSGTLRVAGLFLVGSVLYVSHTSAILHAQLEQHLQRLS
jgi:hypothetical protein